ncbi:MAG: FlgD immunoglobulin-like domain containing protein [Candidatus Celaenobacter antarcticus]|nr:FlgD immunoglobulin-like domain containing protein [Candidatus Celaenobacter antarcticus]
MKKIVLLIFLMIFISNLSATIINIPLDYSTIQEGINASVNNDTILVQPGTYAEEINFNGKDIIVTSLFITNQNCSYIDSTILTTQNNGNIIIFESGESANARLQGFTIQNGYNGVYCENSNPILSNLHVENNWRGISLINSSPDISNCKVYYNFNFEKGPGIYCIANSCPTITNCLIEFNYILELDETWGSGGGLYCENNSNVKVLNTVIASNSADYTSGGIYCNNSEITLINSNIIYNWVNNFGGAIYGVDNSSIILINSIIYGNHNAEIYFSDDYTINEISIAHTLLEGGESGIVTNDNCTFGLFENNINTNPFFVDALNENYHLQDSSLCIGAGIDEIEINSIIYSAPIFDIEGNPRPAPEGSMPDMGSYENALGEPVVGIDEEPDDENPCLSNYPNPFSTSTLISYYGSTNSHEISQIKIYNLKGQLVRELRPISPLPDQSVSVTWDGRDGAGKEVSSGFYFYKLSVNSKTEAVEKCLLVK